MANSDSDGAAPGGRGRRPEQIGAITYQNSVGFTCLTANNDGPADLVYNVAGYQFLTATSAYRATPPMLRATP